MNQVSSGYLITNYLQDFINGVQVLKKEKVHFGNKSFSLNILLIISDPPARAMI